MAYVDDAEAVLWWVAADALVSAGTGPVALYLELKAPFNRTGWVGVPENASQGILAVALTATQMGRQNVSVRASQDGDTYMVSALRLEFPH